MGFELKQRMQVIVVSDSQAEALETILCKDADLGGGAREDPSYGHKALEVVLEQSLQKTESGLADYLLSR